MHSPVYFISDVHLAIQPSEEEHKKQQRLFQFFHHVAQTGGTLFILGDLFDFYFEYPYVIPKMYFQLYHELFHLKSKGVALHFMAGNHDYWFQDFISEKLFDKTYTDDTVVEVNGKKFYLTHGDGILSWDRGYRLLKMVIRNPVFIWLYRWVHPTIGYSIANWISKKGQHYEHSDEHNERILSELEVFSKPYITNGFDYVITGHYHQATEKMINGGKLLILGDWIHYFTYGYFNGNDLSLKFWETDE